MATDERTSRSAAAVPELRPASPFELHERVLRARGELDEMTEFAECVQAMRTRLEFRLTTAKQVADQAAAVEEFEDWKRTPFVNLRHAASNEHALRDARMAAAVEIMLQWTASAKRGDKVNANADAYVATHLLSVLKGAEISTDDVREAASTPAAVDALSGEGPHFSSGGPQNHAVETVALLVGCGPQTVMRAVRAAKKDQSKRPE